MPKPENIEPYKMKKGTTLNPNGRPKKLINHVTEELRKEGYEPATISHIKDAYMTLINLPDEKIMQIAKSPKYTGYPILYTLVAREMTGSRGLDMLEKLLDRAVGKATQAIDHTSKGKSLGEDMQEYFTLFGKQIKVGE